MVDMIPHMEVGSGLHGVLLLVLRSERGLTG